MYLSSVRRKRWWPKALSSTKSCNGDKSININHISKLPEGTVVLLADINTINFQVHMQKEPIVMGNLVLFTLLQVSLFRSEEEIKLQPEKVEQVVQGKWLYSFITLVR